MIYCVKKCVKPKLTPRTISFRNFKNFDRNKFISDLINADWDPFFNSHSVDEATKTFNSIVSQISDTHAPVSHFKVKGDSCPWINAELLAAIRERDYLLKVATTSQNPDDWVEFRRKRNFVNKLKLQLKNTFYANEVNKSRDDSKNFGKKSRN